MFSRDTAEMVESNSLGILKTITVIKIFLVTATLSPQTRDCRTTVKFLNFRTPDNFAVIYLKLNQGGQTLGYFVKKDANGIVNSEDPDQTAAQGAV